MNEIYHMLFSWDWAKIIQSIASAVTAVFAYKALTIWKQKSKANKKTEFIDTLIDEIHKFITLIQPAISRYKYIKMSTNNYDNIDKLNQISDNQPTPYKTYITKKGAQDSNFLSIQLKECVSTRSKIYSLLAKGQIYDFIDYDKCQKASNSILQQYDILTAVVDVISNQGLYFENPKIQKYLTKVLSQESEDMERHINDKNILLLSFAKKNYEKIYKKEYYKK